jgi:hypothetical protein
MADTKISALPASTVPLAGTEVLPIVQSSTTKQVSVANLTAGRSISAVSFAPTGSTVPTNGMYLPAANSVGISTNGVNAVYIDASQNVLVGTSNASGTAGVGSKVISTAAGFIFGQVTAETTNGAATAYNYYSTGAGAFRFYVGAGGTIFATSIVISAISDQRLKENVRDIDTGLDAIMALKPRRFDWKDGKGQDKKNAAGFIAQEFEDVFPECVGTSRAGEDGVEYKNINHETLIPTLVKAIQEQNQLIDNLTARITALENK